MSHKRAKQVRQTERQRERSRWLSEVLWAEIQLQGVRAEREQCLRYRHYRDRPSTAVEAW